MVNFEKANLGRLPTLPGWGLGSSARFCQGRLGACLLWAQYWQGSTVLQRIPSLSPCVPQSALWGSVET